MWSLKKNGSNKGKQITRGDLTSSLIVKRVIDTSIVEASGMVVATAQLTQRVVEKEAKEKEELKLRLETVFKPYH